MDRIFSYNQAVIQALMMDVITLDHYGHPLWFILRENIWHHALAVTTDAIYFDM